MVWCGYGGKTAEYDNFIFLVGGAGGIVRSSRKC